MDESISEIIDGAKKGIINVEQYFEDNKARTSAFSSLISESIDITIPKEMDKVCKSLDKLRLNIGEYQNYLEFKNADISKIEVYYNPYKLELVYNKETRNNFIVMNMFGDVL